jgi:hypothetical protein
MSGELTEPNSNDMEEITYINEDIFFESTISCPDEAIAETSEG